MTTTTNQTAQTIGRRIGYAIARDVIAGNLPREWTGLDAQDADQIPDGIDLDEVEAEAKAAYLAAISLVP